MKAGKRLSVWGCLKWAAIAGGLLMATFVILCCSTGGFHQSGRGVAAVDANRRLLYPFDLPPSATDVNFETWVKSSIADFRIGEEDFVLWCRRHGWKGGPATDVAFRFADPSRDPKLLETGLQYGEETSASIVQATYDFRNHRACAWYGDK